jgi:hypothetical protein
VAEANLHDTYERGFRGLLWRVRPTHLQRRIDRRLAAATRLAAHGVAPVDAYQRVYDRSRRAVWRLLIRNAQRDRKPAQPQPDSRGAAGPRLPPVYRRPLPERPFFQSPDFHCDAALCGLARWLRAAGYDAAWWPGINDDDLLRKTMSSSAIMLTTDSRLMRRGIVTGGLVPALLVSNRLGKREQFASVARALDLPRKPARCMACGGRLSPVARERVRERIPPRTLPWREHYFLCQRCGSVFWEGTHWPHIARWLDEATRQQGHPNRS